MLLSLEIVEEEEEEEEEDDDPFLLLLLPLRPRCAENLCVVPFPLLDLSLVPREFLLPLLLGIPPITEDPTAVDLVSNATVPAG